MEKTIDKEMEIGSAGVYRAYGFRNGGGGCVFH